MLPCIGFLFLFYAFYSIRKGVVRMKGRRSQGHRIYRFEQPFAFWYEVFFYILYGIFAFSPLLWPGGAAAWVRSLQGLLLHANELLMLWGALVLALAAYQILSGVSYGRLYQRIEKKSESRRFWLQVSRHLVFGMLLISLAGFGVSRLLAFFDSSVSWN